MSELPSLTETIAGSAGYEDAITTILQTGDATWQVDFEDVSIELELDEGSGRLVLSAELGAPPPERRLAVFEALLSYALLWRDTGFVRAGLGGAEGVLVLIADTGVDGLHPAALAGILANFAEKIRIWRDFTVAETAIPAPGAVDWHGHTRIWA
ncbi:MAG: type III secretion system chaperone [Methylocystis sp.]|uniref:type III secretion system chaperone n=1 Tax=Methylocystis sp. TaxID=1911079 RepID=UPI003DA2FAC5